MLTREGEPFSEIEYRLRVGNVSCRHVPMMRDMGKWDGAYLAVQQLHSRDDEAVLREIRRAGLGKIVSENFYNAAEWEKIANVIKMAVCAGALYVSKTFEFSEGFQNFVSYLSVFGACCFAGNFLRADFAKRKVRRHLLGESRAND